MKSLLALLAVALLGVGATACGGSSKKGSTAQTPANATATDASNATPAKNFRAVDADKDDDTTAPGDDTNNNAVLHFGKAASSSDVRAITALVKRYYAAAAALDGAKACSLLYSTLEEGVVEDYGQSPPGPTYMVGKTCPEVLKGLFEHSHEQIAVHNATLKVARVRLEEHHGFVVLSFGKLPERELGVTREGHTWKLNALLDSELP
jgi:hypothetical protein